MSKIALILATALAVSAPLVAMHSTDTFAAAKKAAKGSADGSGGPKTFENDPNTAFIRAVRDLIRSLEDPQWPTSGGKGAKGKKSASD